ncbi:MAG: EAL domain-containing protein [Vibrio sp.]
MLKFPSQTLRTVVVVPFTIVLFITICIVTLIQNNNYEESLETLSQKQLISISREINTGLSSFLSAPFQFSQILAENISVTQQQSFHQNQPLDLAQIQQTLNLSFQRLSPQITQLDSLGFGSAQGDYVGFRNNEDHSISLLLRNKATSEQLHIFKTEDASSPVIAKREKFDPRVRPWYVQALDNRNGSWTPLYYNQDELGYLNMSASAPVYLGQKLIGVIATDLRLADFHDFLAEQQKETDAHVVIFDADQKVIVQSNNEPIFYSENDQQRRTGIEDLKDPALHQLMAYIAEQKVATNQEQSFSFEHDGERYFNYISPFTSSHNLNWTIAITLPEYEISGELEANQTRAIGLIILISLLSVFGVFVSMTRTTQPIQETANAAHKISEGNWDTKMPAQGHIEEINSMVTSFNNMTSTLKRSFDTLREQITYDSLTRLYSRQGFIDAVTATRASEDVHGAFLLCSVERFRDINDTLGHFRGDKVLIIMAERLKNLLDSSHILARVNGDEFVIYAPYPSRSGEMNLLIDKIQKKFQTPIKVGTEEVLVHVVMGVSSTNDAQDINQWLHCTGIALSHAKSDPRRLVYYTPEMAHDSFKRTQTIVRINRALECQEFVPYYQPIVALDSDTIVGAEALARWICPEKGLIPPLEFIPIAEEYGQISFIGQQILHKACSDTKMQIDAGVWPMEFHLHVNISVHQLSMPSFTQTVADILAETQLPPRNLTLEITESHIVENDPVLIENMKLLRRLGVGIAIDDFGTGYSSLAYLHKLPFDCLKIDRCFINNLDEDSLETSVVASILHMTSTLNIEIVAEGIETVEQANLLKKLNCQQAQGFYYARPVPLEQWPTSETLPTKV